MSLKSSTMVAIDRNITEYRKTPYNVYSCLNCENDLMCASDNIILPEWEFCPFCGICLTIDANAVSEI